MLLHHQGDQRRPVPAVSTVTVYTHTHTHTQKKKMNYNNRAALLKFTEVMSIKSESLGCLSTDQQSLGMEP